MKNNIKYVIDKNLKYNPDILKHLRAYNTSRTGELFADKKFIYILENDVLVGALHTSVGWSWIDFSEFYYRDLEILKLILSKLSELYKGLASGVSVYTNVESRLKDFQSVGFEIEGTVNVSKDIKPNYSLVYYDLNMTSDSKLDVIIQAEPIEEYKNFIDNYQIEFNKANDVLEKKEDIIIAALDKEIFAGGVQAIIYDNYMYIDLLVVDDNYRGYGIGSKLMRLIEVEARERNLVYIDLGTAEFQAKGFYEKLGYEVVVTKKDQPKGFNCYTMVKVLV